MGDGLGILGLSLRAGELAVGDTAVKAAIRDKKARLICTAEDTGARVLTQAAKSPEWCNGLYVHTHFTQAELGSALGYTKCGVVAFLDDGLAWSFVHKLAEGDHVRYGELADEMQLRKERTLKRRAKKKKG